MKPTLEQERAAHAWKACQERNGEYKRLAKGAPALIMGSGLLQTLAFLHEKGRKSADNPRAVLEQQLRGWIHQRHPNLKNGSFEDFLQSLIAASPAVYQQATAEALAWLRWVRQMAAAAIVED